MKYPVLCNLSHEPPLTLSLTCRIATYPQIIKCPVLCNLSHEPRLTLSLICRIATYPQIIKCTVLCNLSHEPRLTLSLICRIATYPQIMKCPLLCTLSHEPPLTLSLHMQHSNISTNHFHYSTSITSSAVYLQQLFHDCFYDVDDRVLCACEGPHRRKG